MINPYDDRYDQDNLYWGLKPSTIATKLVKLLLPAPEIRLLDVGCGEGRNALYFARAGYEVTAFDLSQNGVDKTNRLADEAHLELNAFQADLREYRLDRDYDIIFSTGSLHYLPEELRRQAIADYQRHTLPNGLHAFTVLVADKTIPPAPDAEPAATLWPSRLIFSLYSSWRLEHFEDTIIDCNSSGVAHQHAVNRMIARKLPL